MPGPVVGIQPIIFGDRKFEDPTGCLDEVREAGFCGVEAPNYFQRFEPDKVKHWFNDRGLVVPATHGGYHDIEDPEKLTANLDFVQSFGGRYIIVSGTKDQTLEGYDESIEVFNMAGEICRSRGLRLLYHNHAWEFKEIAPGVRGIDRIIERTDPSLVGLNIDVYWVHVGGVDPAEFVYDYGHRSGYYHFKDGGVGDDGQPYFAELGQGTVDLAAALEAAKEMGAQWIVYEQDRTERDTFDSLTMSREHLRAIGV